MNIYDFKARTVEGKEIAFQDYKGKVVIIVNTASKCGFTPQYHELQALYDQYAAQGLEILAFPSNQFAEQEPGTNVEVKNFCQLNFGVTFPLFEKNDVRGETAQPLFEFLTEHAPFKGFDLTNPAGERLQTILQQRFPEFLKGNAIKWNFTKFLIDRDGNLVGRYEPPVSPLEMKQNIEQLLGR